ncbi:2-succinyl-5-enolpyruvyl-6-hydroxy-3-cyclohexene-1-carboxylic-acid synthase [Alteribacillus iranensis]|uniref:2-succinyl-5-enolpyruvyl-6-hydroxy-3-cyclohexene-1-carboxylate synthase n=1 Tax=Alteribacillus iranensis TaxID=930128 RepID=A0A1I2A0D6_9BACI|nr:2-succinyl-5-enolpyruvyl-6-hydroxy-3-cyclohexene-1-carboxylic-acid synthase [Alteribacillus iranensis]SFE37227.1 2-succinyl-5-enolpyruvyl-6-hydroxy-3-cyclohexene-1-carboxylate synthase [Alteribacillus iranensis]
MNDRREITSYLSSFVKGLYQGGIKHAVVSPGSRSTPLAMMLSAYPEIEVQVNMDERSAGFYALGLAKALNEPVAVVCTSGTAAANFYPAVVEAFYARVPLVVLTADRPHELRDTGAPQTIDQIHMYGKHVKWFMDVSLPESSQHMQNYVKTIAVRAGTTSVNNPIGPVHLNLPFRDPLVPDMQLAKQLLKEKHDDQERLVRQGSLTLSKEQIHQCLSLLTSSSRGIIICGELQHKKAQKHILELAEQLQFPVLADPLSHIRSNRDSEAIIDTYDTFLRNEKAVECMKPDVVLRFGAMPVSKPLLLFLKKWKDAEHLIVDEGSGWREPVGVPAHMFFSDEETFCSSVLKELANDHGKDSDWLSLWKTMNDQTKSALQHVYEDKELNEGKLFALLQKQMPEDSTLFVGNSMPIRDVDTFFHTNNKGIQILANRGANGIDGVVSTAIGVSQVRENTILAIGDISFYHDMNGLLAAKQLKCDLTIIVVNNDGGGIFSFLPQSQEEEYFEKLFGTPHGLDFSHAAALYDASFYRIHNWDEWDRAFQNSMEKKGLKIIEVQTERTTNATNHRKLWEHVSHQISNLLEGEKGK